MKLISILGLLLVSLLIAADETTPSQPLSKTAPVYGPVMSDELPIDFPLDGPQSMYTPRLLSLTKDLKAARSWCKAETAQLGIHAVGMRTKGRPYYVGFKKCMVINAPLSAVEAVKDDVEHYGDLFPGFKEVKVVMKKGNRTVLSWEKEIPVFFVPNIKYEINYLSVKPNPTTHLYRYQFRKGDRLKFNDGLEILEADGPNRTLFTNYEWYEADYGVGVLGIKAAGEDTVWMESHKGGFISMLSIRFKSEHPEWSYKKIAQEREDAIQGIDFNKIVYEKSEKNS